jgi:hypothetical protein
MLTASLNRTKGRGQIHKYQQVYLYRLGPPTDGPNEIPLVEEHQARAPSPEVCTEINSSGQALEGASR